MPPRSKPLSKSFAVPKVYKDDLMALNRKLEPHLGNTKVTTEDHEYNSLQEYLSSGMEQRPSSLEIRWFLSGVGRISLNFERYEARLYTSDDSPAMRGLFSIATEHLRTLQKKFFGIRLEIFSKLLFCLSILSGAFLVIAFSEIVTDNKYYNIILATVGLLLFLLPVLLHYSPLSKTRILANCERSSTSWLSRHRDELAVNIIGSIIAALIVSLLIGS